MSLIRSFYEKLGRQISHFNATVVAAEQLQAHLYMQPEPNKKWIVLQSLDTTLDSSCDRFGNIISTEITVESEHVLIFHLGSSAAKIQQQTDSSLRLLTQQGEVSTSLEQAAAKFIADYIEKRRLAHT